MSGHGLIKSVTTRFGIAICYRFAQATVICLIYKSYRWHTGFLHSVWLVKVGFAVLPAGGQRRTNWYKSLLCLEWYCCHSHTPCDHFK